MRVWGKEKVCRVAAGWALVRCGAGRGLSMLQPKAKKSPPPNTRDTRNARESPEVKHLVHVVAAYTQLGLDPNSRRGGEQDGGAPCSCAWQCHRALRARRALFLPCSPYKGNGG